jgi:hypothetical protein
MKRPTSRPAPRPQARPAGPTDATHVAKYGKAWPRLVGKPPPNAAPLHMLQDVDIELRILRDYDRLSPHGLMPWTWHYQRLVSLIWGHPNSGRKFVWNPNAVRMLEKVHEMAAANDKKYLSVAGHASSSKSEFFAVYAITSFLIGERHPDHPTHKPSSKYVKVFVTSTTLEESRGRIWGTIESYWLEAARFFGGESVLGAKLVSSMGKIVRVDSAGNQDALSGIVLIAGGKGQDKDVDTKIGFKNRKVVMIADELPLLTHKLYDSAMGNLASNPVLQFIGLGNMTSAFDPFGVMAEPKDGWASIDESMDGWETKNGYCIRFNGEKSPNVVAGREVYPGLLTLETVQGWRQLHGTKHPEYYRMCLAYLSPDGDTFAIYTDAEIIGTQSNSKVTSWVGDVKLVAFLDPAFSQGGDEADMAVCKVGRMYNAAFQREVTAIELLRVENLMLKYNAQDKERDRNTQLVDLFHERCERFPLRRFDGSTDYVKIPVEDRGVDATGAGDPFATLMAIKMGQGFQKISFAGAPSDKPVSSTDRRLGTERFANRVSELWYVGKDLMKGGQVRGLDPDTCNQMRARLYKLADREKVEVEPKRKMKERTSGKSPDRADAFFGCIEIARRRHNLSSSNRAAPNSRSRPTSGSPEWDALNQMAARRRATMADLGTPSLGSGGGNPWGGY